MSLGIRGNDGSSAVLFVRKGELYYKGDDGVEHRVASDVRPVQSLVARIKNLFR